MKGWQIFIMINCPKCGKKISEFVVNCPHCGNANIIDGNDTLKVAKLSKEQRANSKKQIIIYICIILLIINFLRTIMLLYNGLFRWGWSIFDVVPYLTSNVLSIGVALLCLQLIIKKDDEWKLADTIVLLNSALKIIIYIINSIVYIPLLQFIETGRSIILEEDLGRAIFASIFAYLFDINMYVFLIPNILILLLMINKRRSIKN